MSEASDPSVPQPDPADGDTSDPDAVEETREAGSPGGDPTGHDSTSPEGQLTPPTVTPTRDDPALTSHVVPDTGEHLVGPTLPANHPDQADQPQPGERASTSSESPNDGLPLPEPVFEPPAADTPIPPDAHNTLDTDRTLADGDPTGERTADFPPTVTPHGPDALQGEDAPPAPDPVALVPASDRRDDPSDPTAVVQASPGAQVGDSQGLADELQDRVQDLHRLGAWNVDLTALEATVAKVVEHLGGS